MKKKTSTLKWLQDSFIVGFLIVAPIVITYWILVLILNISTSWIGIDLSFPYRIIVFFIVIIVIIFIGAFAKRRLANRLLKFFESILDSIPVVKNIYESVKKIFEAFRGDSKMFRQVVFFEYTPNVYSIGFIVSDAPEKISRKFGEKTYSVFQPASPPTQGMLLFVPESKIIYSEMKVSEGIQFVISNGAAVPKSLQKKMKRELKK